VSRRRVHVVCALALLAGCASPPPDYPPQPPVTAQPPPPPPPPPDPLGPKPDVAPPAAFAPPAPKVFQGPNGMTVWLLERHALPIVSIDVVVPYGAASDPKGKEGVSWLTASMLDEGAGARGAVALSRDIDLLGATLSTGAYADYAFAQLTTLKKNLEQAAPILADVVARPTLSGVELKRVHDLWMNDLKARQKSPSAAASVVLSGALFGEGHPYAHPTNGTTASAAHVGLEDVKAFYRTHWRPDAATCVVAGDLTEAEATALLSKLFAGWKAPKGARPEPKTPEAPKAGTGRRVIVVDRPEASQSVITVGRASVAAADGDAAALVRVNAALGGSFTSRLNQDLREEHGWSYGAHSRLSFSRGPGMFSAAAAVQTQHTGDALKAMLADVEAMAREGLTADEVGKTRLLARAELVEAYEGVQGATTRLARYAGVGLTPEHEGRAAIVRDAADAEALARLARKYITLDEPVIVVVGPKKEIAGQLAAIGLGAFEERDAEGQRAAPPEKARAPKPGAKR
jgi:zinc protease